MPTDDEIAQMPGCYTASPEMRRRIAAHHDYMDRLKAERLEAGRVSDDAAGPASPAGPATTGACPRPPSDI
jgi:hypothetical protein